MQQSWHIRILLWRSNNEIASELQQQEFQLLQLRLLESSLP